MEKILVLLFSITILTVHGCDQIFTSENGLIKNPIRGRKYKNNQDCVYEIQVLMKSFYLILAYELYLVNFVISETISIIILCMLTGKERRRY